MNILYIFTISNIWTFIMSTKTSINNNNNNINHIIRNKKIQIIIFQKKIIPKQLKLLKNKSTYLTNHINNYIYKYNSLTEDDKTILDFVISILI